MNTLTKEWLLKTIAELEEERDAVPGVVNEDAANALAAMKLALASLEAEPVISHLGSKNALDAIVAFIKSNRNPTLKDYNEVSERLFQDNCHGLSNHVIEYIKQIGEELEELRSTQDTAPPAPASVPDVVSWEDVPEEITEDDIALASAWAHGFNQCRAAMLQGAEQTNYRAIVERIAEIVHGKVTDIDLLTVTVKSIKDNLQGKASLRDEIRSEHAEWSQSTFGDVGPTGPLKHLSKEALEAAAEPDDLSEWADMQFLLWDAQRRAGITDEKITQALIDKLAVNKARQWPEPKDGEPRLHIKVGLKLGGQEKQKK